MHPRLRGRRRECEVIDGLLATVRTGESRVLVIRGEAGTGKTALLDHLAASASGFRVARAAGVESEMELVYAGLHQLCAPFAERIECLPGPQRDALGTAFGLRSGDAPNRFLVGLAVLGLISDAGSRARDRRDFRRAASPSKAVGTSISQLSLRKLRPSERLTEFLRCDQVVEAVWAGEPGVRAPGRDLLALASAAMTAYNEKSERLPVGWQKLLVLRAGIAGGTHDLDDAEIQEWVYTRIVEENHWLGDIDADLAHEMPLRVVEMDIRSDVLAIRAMHEQEGRR